VTLDADGPDLGPDDGVGGLKSLSGPASPIADVRRYPPGPFATMPGPTVSFEVVAVDGEEGRELRAAQIRAIRDLLMWVHTERQRRIGPKEGT
jgi:hypothetical protein